MGIENVIGDLNNASPVLAVGIPLVSLAAVYVLGRLHERKLADAEVSVMLRKYDWTKEYDKRTIREAMESGEPSTLEVSVKDFSQTRGGYTGHISNPADPIDAVDFFIFYNVRKRSRDILKERGILFLLGHLRNNVKSIQIKAYYDREDSCFIIGYMSGEIEKTNHKITIVL